MNIKIDESDHLKKEEAMDIETLISRSSIKVQKCSKSLGRISHAKLIKIISKTIYFKKCTYLF